MEIELLIGLLPIAVAWVSKWIWPHKISWQEFGLTIGMSTLVTTIILAAGSFYSTADVEVWNGKVVSKSRVHDTYLESYSCNCRSYTTGTGNNRTTHTQCDTCYRRHYTVNWSIDTTLHSMRIDHEDSTSQRVYDLPDPTRYTIIQPNDPVSDTYTFSNYVKAVPESLFHFTGVQSQFNSMIPVYPSEIYDIYRLNRVISVGVPIPDIKEWNDDLSKMLGEIGPTAKANAVIVFVNTADQKYYESLRTKWLNGKKNDAIIVIGTTHYPTIDWVRVVSWTDRELFKVQLRDDIINMKVVDRTTLIGVIYKNLKATFVRKNFKDFEYLKYEIDPPIWVLVLAFLIAVGSSGWLSYYFYREEM